MRLLAVLTLVLLTSATTLAEEQRSPSRKGKLVANFEVGSGYRAIFPTDDQFCGSFDDRGAPASNCVGRSPMLLGLGVGYGISKSVELFAELGIGIESDFGPLTSPSDGPRTFSFAPGVRGYVADLGPLQLFSGLQFVVDFTDFSQSEGSDYAIRNINGLQLDVHRTIGIHIYFGESVGFNRWLSFALEAGVGLQARFP